MNDMIDNQQAKKRQNNIRLSPIERDFLFTNGSGFASICPDFFETRTLVPSSRNLRATFVVSL
jgi:hypothetical protein